MQTRFFRQHFNDNNTPYQNPNFAQLRQDSVSFRAMKKSQFCGIDRPIVEKFKAPIEKFNILDDFQNWALQQIEKLTGKNFGGKERETIIKRRQMLKEWFDHVLKEKDLYTNAVGLLILSAITKDLKPNNNKLPPKLNKEVLANCISEIDKNSEVDKKYQFNLRKIYETKLRTQYLKNTQTKSGETGWVVIHSKLNDEDNFASNIEKLKILSHKSWCTQSFNAEPYLAEGDFHVYLENGQPKLGVRFVGDAIREVAGELNDGNFPLDYLDELKKHINKNGLKLKDYVQWEMGRAGKIKAQLAKEKKA